MIRLAVVAILVSGALALSLIAYHMIEGARANMLHTFHQDEDSDAEVAAAAAPRGYGPQRSCVIAQRGDAWVKRCTESEAK